MKTSLKFSIVLILFPASLLAQKPMFAPQSHEIGLHLVNAHFIPELADEYNSPGFGLTPVQGIHYAYHITRDHGVRLAFNRRTASLTSFPAGNSSVTSIETDKSDLSIQLGYMYKYHMRALQWYIGAQAIYNRTGIDEQGLSGTDIEFSRDYSYNNMGAGLFTGLRLYTSTHLSFALELQGYFFQIQQNDEPEERFSLLGESETGVQAIFSVSYHFVKMPKRCACPKVRR